MLNQTANTIKYLYILTSDITDFYLEQALLSIYSLRSKIPESYITLLVDDITELNLVDNRSNILNIVNEFISIKIDSSFNKKARSRWLKTSMRQYIKNDFLFIDSDTIITEDLSSLNNMELSIGAVLNEHIYLSDLQKNNPNYYNNTLLLSNKLNYISTANSNYYFNSGVMICRDLPAVHNFFIEWHKQWLYCLNHGIVTDQQSFNQTNYSLGNIISELEGKWNCQIMADGGINYLYNAKILHYFGGMEEENTYFLASHKILNDIKEKGFIDQNIKELLINPKCLFVPNSRLRVSDKFARSITYIFVKKLFYSKIGTFFEFLLSFIYRNIIIPIKHLFKIKK